MRVKSGAVLLAATLLLLRAAGADESVTMNFAPPDGTTFTVTRTIESTLTLGDVVSKEKKGPFKNVFVFRKTPTGVDLIMKPETRSSSLERRIESFQDLAATLTTSSDITIRYDRNGRLTGIYGLEEAAQVVREFARAPEHKELASAVDRLLPIELNNFTERWRGQFEPFLGRSFPVGKFGSGELSLPLPGGKSIAGTAEIGVSETRVQDGKTLALLMCGYTSTDEALTHIRSDLMLDLLRSTLKAVDDPRVPAALKRLDAEFPQIALQQMWLVNERVMDIGTMLTLHETEKRAFKIQITLPDGQKLNGSIARLTTDEYSYKP